MIQATTVHAREAGPIIDAPPALEATPISTPDVAEIAMKLLRSCSHSPVRRVQCRFHEGVLILSGQVPTFYMKQVAQELLRNLQRVEQIDNRLSVTERRRCREDSDCYD